MPSITNTTRATTVAHNVRVATGFIDRLRGLMGVNSLAPHDGLLLQPESSIHTFFMRFALDVVYLDRTYTVLRLDPNMAPWRIGPLYTHHCHAILELPVGALASSQTQVGDKLKVTGDR